MFSRYNNLQNFINKLSAQETTIKFFELALHISALQAGRKAIIKEELSNKLKLTICRNIRPLRNIYTTGDEVYY